MTASCPYGCTTEDILTDQYLKLREDEMLYQAERLDLPVGSIQKKTIKGKEYHYLQYRDGNKVHSQYIKQSELDDVRTGVERRKELSNMLNKIDLEKHAIELLVDVNELIIAEIKKVMQEENLEVKTAAVDYIDDQILLEKIAKEKKHYTMAKDVELLTLFLHIG